MAITLRGKRLLANMNMPPTISTSQIIVYKDAIRTATEKVAQHSMARSCDGTWQRRGFSSKNGKAAVLSVNPRSLSKSLLLKFQVTIVCKS